MSRVKSGTPQWLKEQLRLFGRLWKEVSPAAATLWLLDRTVFRFLPCKGIVIALFDRIDCLADHATLPAGYQMERASRDQLYGISRQHPDALSPDFIDEALSKGDIPFVTFRGEELAEFHWFADTPTGLFGDIWIQPPPDRLYGYKGFVAPSHRGIALHSLGKRVRAQALSRAHLKGIVSFVDAANSSSLLSAGKIPGQRFGFALFWSGRGKCRAYVSRACVDAGIQFTSPERSTGGRNTRAESIRTRALSPRVDH